MPKAKGSEESKTEEAVTEVTEEPKGLSRRDATEVAIATLRESKPEEPVEPVTVVEEPEKPTEKPLEPPGEWLGERKESFRKIPREFQEEILRVNKGRDDKLDQIKAESARLKAEKEELAHIKQLADSLTPYLKAQGVNKPTEVAMKEALAMWQEFSTDDQAQAKRAAAAYLQSRGIEPPKELVDQVVQTGPSPETTALHERLGTLEQRIALEDQARAASVLTQVWASFEQEKNAAGTLKYPDIGGSESGIKLAGLIGTLVRGETPMSQEWIRSTRERIPDASPSRILEEAYKYYGGRVDDSRPPTKSQSPQSHLIRSSRAASSVPGRGVAGSSGEKKFATRREAAEAALAQLNGR